MKIIYLSSSTIPSRAANSIHVMKMCQAFSKNGHEIVLIAQDKKVSREPGVQDVYKFYGVDKCFEIINLPWLPIRGRGQIYGLVAGINARALKPDLVYCRNTAGCFFAATLRLPVIFESHVPLEENEELSAWMFRRILKSIRLQKLVVITHALKEYYENNYSIEGVEIQVAPDGADPVPDKTEPVILPNKNKRMQVGYVGHLYKGRGVDTIIELAKRCHWVDFHLVGGTDADIAYWKFKTVNQPNIYFHGFVSPAEAERLRIGFDVLLAPYQREVSISAGGNTASWMSPLKLFEYMAAGKPIICSDHPVLKEVVQHEKNALLCPPGDIDAWERAICKLKESDYQREALGAQALKTLLHYYTWEARAKKILDGAGAI